MNDYIVTKSCDKLGRAFFYCHKRDYPYMPVFGSIGDKEKAKDICKLMNHDGKVRYS